MYNVHPYFFPSKIWAKKVYIIYMTKYSSLFIFRERRRREGEKHRSVASHMPLTEPTTLHVP